jgi:peptide/nickel transport system permease protein
MKEKNDEEIMLIIKKYKKRSRFGNIFHRILKNKGATAGLIIICFMFLVFCISLFMNYDSITSYTVQDRFLGPSFKYPFGTDNMGRNLFYRVVYGTRYSIVIGFSVVAGALLAGVTVGSIAGYYSGTVDNIIMRCIDVLASIPGLLMSMVLVTVLGQSIPNLIFAVVVSTIPMFARVTRGSILTVRNNEFVEAARAIGFRDFRIIFTQVLPNALSPVIVSTSGSIGMAIMTAAMLSYLGFGVPVPLPEWGALISVGREHANTAPWLTLFPGLAIMLVVLALNLLGDGLRDALDPKLKR